MPCIYEIEVGYTPLEKIKEGYVASFFAIHKVQSDKKEGNEFVIKFIATTGDELKNLKKTLEWWFEDKAKIKFNWVKQNLILKKKEKNYLEYCAECYSKDDKPLSEGEFRKKYFGDDDAN
jgi:hypothetical protein